MQVYELVCKPESPFQLSQKSLILPALPKSTKLIICPRKKILASDKIVIEVVLSAEIARTKSKIATLSALNTKYFSLFYDICHRIIFESGEFLEKFLEKFLEVNTALWKSIATFEKKCSSSLKQSNESNFSF